MSKVYILSEAIQTGKTTALQVWVKNTSHLSGFLSPVIHGKRMFQDIETGALIPMETARKDLVVGKYVFDASSFEVVEDHILKAWEAAKVDMIVLDEIGPLEIKKNLGFHKLLLKLRETISSKKPQLLFVVRDNCLDFFLKKYLFEDVKVMSLQEFKKAFDS